MTHLRPLLRVQDGMGERLKCRTGEQRATLPSMSVFSSASCRSSTTPVQTASLFTLDSRVRVLGICFRNEWPGLTLARPLSVLAQRTVL